MTVRRSVRREASRTIGAALACAATLLALVVLAVLPGRADAAATHCVHANLGGTICTYGGLNTYANDFPGTGFTIWRGSFWNATTGTSKAINRISYCCSGEWYSSSVKDWDQNIPGRTTQVITFYNWHPNPVNVVAFWKHT